MYEWMKLLLSCAIIATLDIFLYYDILYHNLTSRYN